MQSSNVFVSFRGTDTRRTFVSHLLLALYEEGFRTFKQKEEIPENEPASSQVLQSIEESRAAVVVISSNFASSASCLDQLVKVIECMDKRSLLVVPVFYEIDPTDVLKQADNLMGHGNGDNFETDPKVERWRDALTKFTSKYHHFFDWEQDYSFLIGKIIDFIIHLSSVPQVKSQEFGKLGTSTINQLSEPATSSSEFGNLGTSRINQLTEPATSSTHETESDELSLSEIRTLVVQDLKAVLGTIFRKPISVKPRSESFLYGGNELSRFAQFSESSSLVGMDRHMKELHTLLDLDSEVYPLLDLDSEVQVHSIGILGVGGIGKTTLARYVYEKIAPRFQDHCYYFLNDARKYPPCRISTCLLEEVTRVALTPTSQSPLSRNCDVVKLKLGHRKVLLMVDGLSLISEFKDITTIARLFGPGSRLIVVTQDVNLLLDCGVEHIYEVESLYYDEAIELFSQFAFKQKHIPRGFSSLVVRAVLITGRIPLNLKVFGSFLCGKNTKEWEFELCRIEASQDNCIAEVSSYIVDAQRNQDRYTGEEHEGEEFPSYSFALG